VSDYATVGFTLLAGLIPREVANGLLAKMRTDFKRQNIDLARLAKAQPLLERPAVEIYGHHYPPYATFHWGLTPAIEAHVGRPLLPTYCYFRLYRQGDVCKVHGDRPACEHSLSLTLGYADGVAWPLELARAAIEKPYQRADAAFREDEDAVALAMEPGDGVLYQGVRHHHGRTVPNPNRWSAHLFLHWVERGGAFAGEAFDGQVPPENVPF
jgi:hypothetical protein